MSDKVVQLKDKDGNRLFPATNTKGINLPNGQILDDVINNIRDNLSENNQKLNRALYAPVVKPTEIKIPAVDETNSQIMFGLSEDFEIESDKLKLTGVNISNPNLLINGDFKINQRGQDSYSTANDFTVDGWKIRSGSNIVFNVTTKKITFSSAYSILLQQVEDYESLKGKTITFSVKCSEVSGTVRLNIYSSSLHGVKNITSAGITTLTATIPIDITSLTFMIECTSSTGSITLEYAKVELGSIATPFSPKPYEEELASCQVIEGGIATTYSNPNLLINGDFRVNQRGKSTYYFGTDVYSVDRWKIVGGKSMGTIDVLNNGVTWNIGGTGMNYEPIMQLIEQDFSNYIGKTITASINVEITGTTPLYLRLVCYSDEFSTVVDNKLQLLSNGLNSLSMNIPENTKRVKFAIRIGNANNGGTLHIDYAKLELGSVATSYSPRPYAEELALCQRYYQIIRLQGGAVTASTTTSFYPTIPLATSMRTKPTISITIYPAIRGNGKQYISTAENTTIISNEIFDNLIQINFTTSEEFFVGLQMYALANGTATLDAEIY